MHLDAAACYRAIASRDRRFEGRFVVAVRTTGVYCRPGCPAPVPREQNVTFYACAAGAEEAGYRPCFRCRPDASPDTSAWLGTSATIRRALRLISDEGIGEKGVDALAERLGIGDRHLRRLFAQHVGASPSAVGHTRRMHFARKLLDETDLRVSDVAFASGFTSIRRFNDAVRKTFRKPPSALRRSPVGRRGPRDVETLTLRVAYKPPLDWAQIVAFLGPRATPGVEAIDASSYRRTFATEGGHGVLEVAPDPQGPFLVMSARAPAPSELFAMTERVRSLFDLGLDPDTVSAHLARDSVLQRSVRARPGLRVPGAWDPFELAVRAILGQQVSVAGATTLAGRVVQRFGTLLDASVVPESRRGELTHAFPRPEILKDAPVETIGIPGARARAIRALAASVASGSLVFGALVGLDEAVARLALLPGIGPWTAHYIAMRALREPDAFPSSDLVLRRALGPGEPLSAGALEARAESWRPWRAYAAMHLWANATHV
jgi:AraC family transcriptional regulator of adaptative response / DNA-3-methyladenine glycosylase II